MRYAQMRNADLPNFIASVSIPYGESRRVRKRALERRAGRPSTRARGRSRRASERWPALPYWPSAIREDFSPPRGNRARRTKEALEAHGRRTPVRCPIVFHTRRTRGPHRRSEERRVGKGGR